MLLKPGDEFIAARNSMAARSINSPTPSKASVGTWCGPTPTISGSFERAVTPHTKAIFIESIANPGGSITDIEAIAAVARKAGVPLIVDNTWRRPI